MNSTSDKHDILLAHEWIEETGGSENVFRNLIEAFPDADAVCLWNDIPQVFGYPVRETFLARTKLRHRKALALPVMPHAWKRTDLAGYDTVLASSHAFAHHLASQAARTGRRAFAYVHSPARYLWMPQIDQRGSRMIARAGGVPLRRYDRQATDSRVQYAANSDYIRRRINDTWNQDATVIHPPVEVARIADEPQWANRLNDADAEIFESLPKNGFILGASRLVQYKRLDRVIELGAALDLPVVIAGSGPASDNLKAIASSVQVPVHFTGRVSDELLYALYQSALLFAFLGIEDFGIMPIEAIAGGTPVLVNSDGGAREGVLELKAGAEVESLDRVEAMVEAAYRAMACDMSTAKENLAEFSPARFQAKIADWIGIDQ